MNISFKKLLRFLLDSFFFLARLVIKQEENFYFPKMRGALSSRVLYSHLFITCILFLSNRSSLKNYRVLKRTGAFHKTEAIQSAVSTISDPHSIVLLYDLHLLTPTNLFSAVRKVILLTISVHFSIAFKEKLVLCICKQPGKCKFTLF